MVDVIKVGYRPVIVAGVETPAQHMFIIYSDYSDYSVQDYYFGAKPQFDTPHFFNGKLVAEVGLLSEESYDSDWIDSPATKYVAVAISDDLSKNWLAISDVARKLNISNIDYREWADNSNYAVVSALRAAGLILPANGPWTPGRDSNAVFSDFYFQGLPGDLGAYPGDGAHSSPLDDAYCFIAGTKILMADGSERSIEEIVVGDYVSSFNPLVESGRGALVPAKVVRLFKNYSDQLVRLSNGVVVTPGHHFLSGDGSFKPISSILSTFDSVVSADGVPCQISGTVENISADHVSGRELYFGHVDGGAVAYAQQPMGWTTYNFEVQTHHTYVAGGMRVHNASISNGTLQDSLNGSASDIVEASVKNSKSENSYDYIKDYDYKPDKAVFNAGSQSELYSQQQKEWRADLLKQAYLADGTQLWVVQYKDVKGNVITKDPDTGKVIDPALVSGRDGGSGGSTSDLAVPSKGPGGESPDGGKHVYIESGKLLEVGKVYAAPSGDSYKINADGSMTSQSTGQTKNVPDKAKPIVLDLDGNGINIDRLSDSNVFMDLDGDGLQNRTAWAAAGDGVLVRDAGNDGIISLDTEVDFTAWDPTAKSDMEALLNVFDTDHDGKLDGGDADWSLFKVMVTNADGTSTLKTLAQLGITSIDLVSNNQEIRLSDGSLIHGTSTYTRSNGTTGRAGDVTLVYEEQGYVVTKVVTLNGDGSTTIVNTGTRPDGSIAHRTSSTTTANGLSRTTEFDIDGNSVADKRQVLTRVVNADTTVTETLLEYSAESQILQKRQVTTRSADGSSVTIGFDESGSNVRFDRVETRVTAANGTQTVTVENRNADNSVHDKVVTVTTADGLSKNVQMYLTSSPTVNATRVETTSVAGNGTRTETVTHYAGSDTAVAKRIASTVTQMSADGSNRTVSSDQDGNGTTDTVDTSLIVHNPNGSTTTTITTTNNDGSVRGKSVTDLSADGYSKTVRVDLDGNGTDDLITTDVKTFPGSGATTQTVTTKAGNNAVLSSTTSTWSADGKTRSVSVDSNGDGFVDRTQTVGLVSGLYEEASSVYSPNGATLLTKSLTKTSADGLVRTTQVDADGDLTYDAVTSVTKVFNANGSSTVTETLKNGAGTQELVKTVITTTADGLQQTVSHFRNGESAPHTQTVATKLLNGDGSVRETVITLSGANLVQSAKAVTDISSDRLTVTTKTFLGTNALPETVTTSVTSPDGSKTQTVSGYSPNGTVLLGKTVTSVSADGLTTTVRTDGDGDADYDGTNQSILTLNASGSTTLVSSQYAGTGTATANKVGVSNVTTSGNGLVITTLQDLNGDGTNDVKVVDATTLGANGSKTRTILTSNESGAVQASKTVGWTSDDGLNKIVTSFFGADATADLVESETTTLAANGSTTTVAMSKNANDALIAKRTVVKSGDGLSVTKTVDLDGDADNDVTAATTTLSNGSVQTVTSTFDATTGLLQSKSTAVLAGNGMSLTIETDLNGDNTIDRRSTDVKAVNADGSKTQTVTNFVAAGVVEGKTTTTTSGDGLTITTQWEGNGSGVTRSRKETTLTAADGSSTKTVSNYKAGAVIDEGLLKDRTITTVSADGTAMRMTRDIDGVNGTDETVTKITASDGVVRQSFMDGAIALAGTREYGQAGGKYVTMSANGLTVTTRYDDTGNGLAESETVSTTVLNSDGSKVETITNSLLSGGDVASADPVYISVLRDKAVITTSANGRSITTQWDVGGIGTLGSSREDITTFGSNGAQTQTLTYKVGSTIDARYQKTSSLDGMTVLERWDNDGNGTYDEVSNKVVVKNADGSTTQTVTNTSGSEPLSTYVTTTSADGRTVTAVETLYVDSELTAPIDNDQTVVRHKTTVTQTLADGSTRVVYESKDGVTNALLERNVTDTSADGRIATLARDSNGDGTIDQIKLVTQHVDGSVTTDLTDKSGATITGRSISVKSADGRVLTTRQDIDGDSVFDRETDHTWRDFADGSTEETITSYWVSQRDANGNVSNIPRGTAAQTTIIRVSADGRTETATVDLPGGDAVDQTTTTIWRIDGSSETTITSNATARAIAPLAGNITWVSANVADATTPALMLITTSADGRDRTVLSDYDGDGVKEHEETWHTAIDGSQHADIVDKNTAGTVIARGIMNVSPDGLVTNLYRDNNADGIYEYMERAVTHLGGGADRYFYALVGNVWVIQKTIYAHPNGQSLVLEGTDGNDTLVGGEWNDILRGKGGDDVLDGRGGADRMEGGTGNDAFIVDNGGDAVVENANEGTDLVKSRVTYTLGANVENLTLIGDAVINATGNSFNNVLVGNGAANVINGLVGADTMSGGGGNDTYVIDNAGDIVTEAANEGVDLVQSSITYTLTNNVENLTLTGSAALNGTGNALANVIIGNSGVNTLSGGTGADTLVGNGGNDTLLGGDGDDVLNGGTGADVLNGGAGFDTASYENATAGVYAHTGSPASNAGEAVGDTYSSVEGLRGSAYADDLILVTSVGRMHGGAGNDYLTFVGTQVEMYGEAGADSLHAGGGNDQLYGGADNDDVIGYGGDDFLDGGTGVDWMVGGAGHDTYVVDNTGDSAIENAGEGTDTVLSSVTYALGVHVENLTLTGSAATNGTGNSLDNVLTGNSAANVLVGSGGNDTLDGAAGADTLIGGTGHDTYIVDQMGDIVTEGHDEGDDLVKSSITYTLGANVERLTLTGASALNGTGNGLNNTITGNAANNSLFGAAGDDILNGGDGDDILSGGLGADAHNGGAGLDYVTYEDATSGVRAHTGSPGSNTGEAAGDTFSSIEGLRGSAFADELTLVIADGRIYGGGGDDVLTFVGDHVEMYGEVGNDSLHADNGNDQLYGGSGNDDVIGYGGNDFLDGGTGVDWMVGGSGDDTYVVDDAGDSVIEMTGEGIDLVQTALTHALAANVENLLLTGSAAVNGTGNSLDNILTGNSAANVLSGGGGNDTLDGGSGGDTLVGGTGNDTYVVDVAGDVVIEAVNEGTDLVRASITYTLGANVENLTLIGSSAINGTGNGLNNILTGNSAANTLNGGAGNDTLDGGTGSDSLVGGTGDDIYVVDVAGDTVTELAGEGTDLVRSAITYALGSNLENLTLIGAVAINGTGNNLSNVLTGNAADNVLNGSSGADTMIGDAGNDTYIVDDSGDTVVEASGAGTDIIQSSVTYTLSANVENLTLTGSSTVNGSGNGLDNIIVGNAAANVLTGGSGNDVLDGGIGNDTLIGGIGDDTYVVDASGDVVTEAASQGIDLVRSTVSYTLGANVENLTLTGSAAINGTGNTLSNVLIGNAAANTLTGGAGHDTLDGGAGSDLLVGGTGDDTYVVDAAGDVVTELLNEGIDTVRSTMSYVLGSNVENVTLLGTANINATGNGLSNVLTGNAGNNLFNGGGGTDTYYGGDGIDTVTYASATAGVTFHANYAPSTYTGEAYNDFAYSIEVIVGSAYADSMTVIDDNFTLYGGGGDDYLNTWGADATFYGEAGEDELLGDYGNDHFDGGADDDILQGYGGNDTLIGGAGADQLYGGDGADIINGGAGFDWLVGGAGNDTFVFAAASGEDTITDFTVHSGSANGDVIELAGQTLSTFAAVMAAATEWNGNTYLHLDGGAEVALNGVAMAHLTADDFRFV